MTMMKMKIYVGMVVSLCMFSCTKGKQLPSIDYSFKLSSDPVASRVVTELDGSVKIRLYMTKTDQTASANYFFSHYITQGRGQLFKSTGSLNYEEYKDYPFFASTTKNKDTLEFKYFPSFTPPFYTVPTTINFVVKNKNYADTIVYQTNISKR